MSCAMSAVTGASGPRPRAAAPYDPDLSALDESRRALLRAASEALSSGAGHLCPGRDRPAVTMPDSDAVAADVETRARALLLQPRLSAQQEQQVTGIIRCIADLRCVVRGAREAARLSRLLRADASGAGVSAETSPLGKALGRLADAAAALADGSAALGQGDGAAAYRGVDAARAKAEAELRGAGARLPADALRVIRGIIWSIMVAAENMARIVARVAGVARSGTRVPA